MKSKLLMVLMLLVCSSAYAEIYSCGPGCYTSSPKKGYGKADIGNKIGRYTSVSPQPRVSIDDMNTGSVKKVNISRAPNNKKTVATQTAAYVAPPSVPKLNPTQTNSRRAILEQELNNERGALAQAQKKLADGRVSRDANLIRRLENAVLDRQQNIQALQRELSRM